MSTAKDSTRERVQQRGLLYFLDVLAEIDARLSSIPHAVIAAACAERLLTSHLGLPAGEQRPFTVSWRRPMDCIWAALHDSDDSARLRSEIAEALQRFYASPLNHSDGQDGPDDADDDAAAACIYAAESFVQDSRKSAGYAVSRLVDAAYSRVTAEQESAEFGDLFTDCCHPIVQGELQWILQLVSYVESHPLTDETVAEIRQRSGARPRG